MQPNPAGETYDYVIIGSGFGGSVSALRLIEKGYRVLVLERGVRFRDQDFPRTNWNIFRYLWAPALRCFGFMQLSLFKGLFVFHSSGVGGGSLVYAGVLMEPEQSFFESPAWNHLGDWKSILSGHYRTAQRMLDVAPNPRLTPPGPWRRTTWPWRWSISSASCLPNALSWAEGSWRKPSSSR